MPPRSEKDGAVMINWASTAVSGSSDSCLRLHFDQQSHDLGRLLLQHVAQVLDQGGLQRRVLPACSMPATERDRRRRARMWRVSRPIAIAARSGASGPSARTLSASRVKADRNRSGPLRSKASSPVTCFQPSPSVPSSGVLGQQQVLDGRPR